MTENEFPISDTDLHAYVDGQLDPQQRQRVETALQNNPQLRETVASYQQQNSLLHQAFDPVLHEESPDRLLSSIKAPTKRQHPWYNVAAGLALLLVGSVSGWSIRGMQVSQSFVVENLARPAAMAHAVYSPEVRHPVEVDADNEQHLIKWLTKRLGATVKAPDLKPSGFNLVGGRLLPASNGPAAQFMYENSRGERLTLYIRKKISVEQNTAFRFYQQNDTNAFYWIDGSLGYVLSGAVNREQLQHTAREIYQQLSF